MARQEPTIRDIEIPKLTKEEQLQLRNEQLTKALLHMRFSNHGFRPGICSDCTHVMALTANLRLQER